MIHLTFPASVGSEEYRKLISLSTTGRNEAVNTIAAKIWEKMVSGIRNNGSDTAKDSDYEWSLTDSGQKNEIGESSVTFYQVKIPRNDGSNFADYLHNNVSISAIAIDGGNRKWFGSDNAGVFLMSADNMEQLQSFTTSNSKLISDNIAYISINPTSGEVFFLSDKGLCSYQSDANNPAETMDNDQIRAYPNPVTPDYTGLITVTGLTYDADVP